MRHIVGVMLAVLALTGCGGKTPVVQATPTVTATPSVTVPPTQPATSTPLTREQAGQKYLAMAKPINAIFDRPDCKTAEDYLVNGGSWDDTKYHGQRADQVLRSCYKLLIPLYVANIQSWQTTLWPADAKQDVADLTSLDQGMLHWLRQAAKGSTAAQMYTALESVPADDGSADRVRARFGLPGRTS